MILNSGQSPLPSLTALSKSVIHGFRVHECRESSMSGNEHWHCVYMHVHIVQHLVRSMRNAAGSHQTELLPGTFKRVLYQKLLVFYAPRSRTEWQRAKHSHELCYSLCRPRKALHAPLWYTAYKHVTQLLTNPF